MPELADHAVQLVPAGPLELGALLRLADADALTPADIRRLLPHVTARPPAGMPAEEASLERRLVASWADNLPIPARDGDWLLVVKELLKDTVDLGHAGYLAYATARRRAHAGRKPLSELTENLRLEWAARLPDHDVTGLLLSKSTYVDHGFRTGTVMSRRSRPARALRARTRAWPRIAAADQHLRDQVLVAHHGLLIVGIYAPSGWRQDWLHYIGTGSS